MKTRIKKLNEFLKALQTMANDFEIVEITNFDVTTKLNPFQSKTEKLTSYTFWSKNLKSSVFINLNNKNKYVSFELWELNTKNQNEKIINILSNVFY